MKNHKILNLIKDFNPRGHRYKENPIGWTFGWNRAEELLSNEFDALEDIEGHNARECQRDNLRYEANKIASGEWSTASNADILEWFKDHGTKRHRQLVKAYKLLPYAHVVTIRR